MIQQAVDRRRSTRRSLVVSCGLHALLLLLLFYQIGKQTGLVEDYDELTEIAYIEARYGEDVASKVKMKAVPKLNPKLEDPGRGIATDSAFKPKEPTPEPPRPEPKSTVAEVQTPQIQQQTKPQLLAFAEQLTGKKPQADSRPIIDTNKLKTASAKAADVSDTPPPRVAKLANHGAFKPKTSGLNGRQGKIIVTDGPTGIIGSSRQNGGVAEAAPDLAGGNLQQKKNTYQPAQGKLSPGSSSGGKGVLDVNGPRGAGGGSTKGRKTILNYGSGNGGRGGSLSGRRTKLVEAPSSQSIVDKQKSGGPAAAKRTTVTDAKLDGKGVSVKISGQIQGRAILESTTPVYSEKAKRNGWEGIVAVHFTVLADGRVKDNMYFDQTSAHRDLNRAAMDALKKFRFASLPAGQAAVEQWGVITIVFRLN